MSDSELEIAQRAGETFYRWSAFALTRKTKHPAAQLRHEAARELMNLRDEWQVMLNLGTGTETRLGLHFLKLAEPIRGVHGLYERLARRIAKLPKVCVRDQKSQKALVAKIREWGKEPDPWHRWTSDDLHLAAWAFDQIVADDKHPSWPQGVAGEYPIARRKVSVREADDGFEALNESGIVIARYPAHDRSNLALLYRGVCETHRAVSERIVRGLVLNVWTRRERTGTSLWQPAEFRGPDDLGRQIGITSPKDVVRIVPILEALQSYRGGRRDIEPALTYVYVRQSPGRPSRLCVTLQGALIPGYASELARRARAGQRLPKGWRKPDLRLIPVLPIPSLPDGLDNQLVGNAYHLQTELLVAMRARLADLPDGWLAHDFLRDAADAARMPFGAAEACLHHWILAPNEWLRPTGELGVRVTLRNERALDVFREGDELAANRETSERIRSSKGGKLSG